MSGDIENDRWGAGVRMINALLEKLEMGADEEERKLIHDLRGVLTVLIGSKYLEEIGA